MNGKSNFNKELFIENATEFLYFECLDIIEQAVECGEIAVECNLYSMITLPDLRGLVGYECEYRLLDKYRDELLTSIMTRLNEEGITTTDTYRRNPYMPAAFAIACVDIAKEELEAIANDFVKRSEGQKAMALVSSLVLFLLLYNAIITAVINKGSIYIPKLLRSNLPQIILCSIIIVLSVLGILFYQRRNIKSFLVRSRILKSKNKST